MQGSIPTFIANIIAVDQPMCIAQINSLLKKTKDHSVFKCGRITVYTEGCLNNACCFRNAPGSKVSAQKAASEPKHVLVQMLIFFTLFISFVTSQASASNPGDARMEIESLLLGNTVATPSLDPSLFNTASVCYHRH